ncbi:MAG: alanine racemase [Lachnospiraceae bacterium]|nr:alanine racemase [Lachnospiraceae bacterium]
MEYFRRVHKNIYPGRVRNNILRISEGLPPGTKRCLVLKADAYGLGAPQIALRTEDMVDFFAVSAGTEAAELREEGIRKPILILGYTAHEDYERLLELEARFTVYREEEGRALNEAALRRGVKAHVHFKLDTGMNRIGFEPTEEAADSVAFLASLPGIEAEGLFSHFATADAADLSQAREQYARFAWFKERLKERGLILPICHIANSAAALVLPEAAEDMVRLGIAAYGFYPSGEMARPVRLEPAIELKSMITHVKMLEAGEGVGYGFAYVAPRPCRLATVSVGYADGYSRLLSGKADVLIRGKRAPVRGNVCMDQLMVDVDRIPEAAVGDEVTLLGTDGEQEITLEELSEKSGILHYEIICGFSHKRVPEVCIDE